MSRHGLLVFRFRDGAQSLSANLRKKDRPLQQWLQQQAQERGQSLSEVGADLLRSAMRSVSDLALVDELKEEAERRDCSVSSVVRLKLNECRALASARPYSIDLDSIGG